MDRAKFLNLALAVGKVISTDVTDRARVLVQLNRFNKHINTYFPQRESLEAYNPENSAKVGDLVLVKKMREARRIVETHKISEIIFAAGFVVDPMTGLRVDQNTYLHETTIDEEEKRKLSESTKRRERSPTYSFEIPNKDILKS